MTDVAKNLHLRGLPEDVHRVLAERAEQEGKSLNSYIVELLADDAALPTMSEWLASIPRMEAKGKRVSGAEVVRAARREDEERLFRAIRRRR